MAELVWANKNFLFNCCDFNGQWSIFEFEFWDEKPRPCAWQECTHESCFFKWVWALTPSGCVRSSLFSRSHHSWRDRPVLCTADNIMVVGVSVPRSASFTSVGRLLTWRKTMDSLPFTWPLSMDTRMSRPPCCGYARCSGLLALMFCCCHNACTDCKVPRSFEVLGNRFFNKRPFQSFGSAHGSCLFVRRSFPYVVGSFKVHLLATFQSRSAEQQYFANGQAFNK